jgi:hypothetical protein
MQTPVIIKSSPTAVAGVHTAIRSFIFVLLLMTGPMRESIGQVHTSNRKDSLSNIGWTSRTNKNGYLFDSLFVTGDTNLISRTRARRVYLISNSGDSSTFYVPTGRILVLNGLIINSVDRYINLDKCLRKKVKVIPAGALKRRFGVSNQNGGIVVECPDGW